MTNIFFTSDTHYWHKNIAGANVSTWKKGYRDFEDVQQMNREIIDQINSTVSVDSTLYHLGDWSFGGIENIWNFRRQINCKNIHLILGNHDHHIEADKILPNCFGNIYNEIIDIQDTRSSGDVYFKMNSQDLFSSVQHVKEIKTKTLDFFLSHYAHRVWNRSHHGVIHLYGHSHASIDDNWGKSMDVGIDNAYKILGHYRPFSLNEIQDIMNERTLLILDHHDSKTT